MITVVRLNNVAKIGSKNSMTTCMTEYKVPKTVSRISSTIFSTKAVTDAKLLRNPELMDKIGNQINGFQGYVLEKYHELNANLPAVGHAINHCELTMYSLMKRHWRSS